MKDRILNNWTITRGLYLVMGILVITQSVVSGQWLGAVIGGYFAAMGLFAFGCASGNCIPNSPASKKANQEVNIEEVNIEEGDIK